MKILSIGNSFSEDAQRWLHSISLEGNCYMDTVNLAIGGCTLETHWDCITNNKADYGYTGNNIERLRIASINEVVENEEFDVITIQQASGFSGQPQSFFPYIYDLFEYIKKHQPSAQIYYHKTWTYEVNSTHGHFKFYNNDQDEMYRRINDCSEMVRKVLGIPVIPVGDFVKYLKENTEVFDYKNGGLSLYRDGHHMSFDYGRFAAAAVWYKTLTGEKVKADKLVQENDCFDAKIINLIIEKLEEFSQQ